MQKIGIMGGTFNPVHYGHLFLAENAYEQLGLDKILFMPSKNPPHKVNTELVTEQQRVDMLTLAISDNPHFELSTVEMEREGITYTKDTLTILTNRNPDSKYFFLVGADALFNMQNWKEPQTIFKLCTIVTASRDNVEQEKINQQVAYLTNSFKAHIEQINMPTIQISSAQIRDRITEEKSVRYYVPDTVRDYIRMNKLYTAAPEDRK